MENTLMSSQAVEQARAQLRELIDAARSGALIPVRLPGQLEAIDQLLSSSSSAADSAAGSPSPLSPSPEQSDDNQKLMQENAKFVSHAVHELRTPMTSIRGYADMLGNPAMGTLSDMQKQFVETIRGNSRRMEGLLTDVSDMAKIRGGTLHMAPKMDMFKNIALMVEKKLGPDAEKAGKKLTFDIPSGLPLLNVDGEMLAKALVKLVENGLRYTPDEGGEVVVSAEEKDGSLVIRIRDNGIGMTADEIAQLGTVYFRSEREEVRAHKGSGLGVPVAFGIIRLLGGSITVESSPETGTTFMVLLPGMR